MQSRASSKLQIKDPELDLLTMDAFKIKFAEIMHAHPTLMSRLPFMEIKKLDGTSKKGILVHADSLNPPPGCLRIISLDEYSSDRITWLADSHSATYANELHDQLEKSMKETKALGSAVKMPKDKKDNFALPDSLWSDKKRGVFASHTALAQAVTYAENHRVQQAAEKQAKEHHETTVTDVRPGGDGSSSSPFFIGAVGADASPPTSLGKGVTEPTSRDIFDDVESHIPAAAATTSTKRKSAGGGEPVPKSARITTSAGAGTSDTHQSQLELKVDICKRMHVLHATLGTSTKASLDAWDMFVDLLVELAFHGKCDLVKDSRPDAILKKTASGKKNCRSKPEIVNALTEIEDVLPALKHILSQNHNAIRIEKASKQNAQRRAAISACFDLVEAANAAGRCFYFQGLPGLPISKTILFRFHSLAIEHAMKVSALRCMRDLMVLSSDSASKMVVADDPSDQVDNIVVDHLSLRTFADTKIATDESCHWQQRMDIQSVLSTLILCKYEPPDMEKFLMVMPLEEAHEDARDHIMIYKALANPDKEGESACRDAVNKLRVSTEGALFPIRYQKYGQDLKSNLINWVGRQMSSSLSQVRLKRLASEASGLACGYDHITKWTPIKKQLVEFQTMSGNSLGGPAASNEHVQEAQHALTNQTRHCLNHHQHRFDAIVAAIGFRHNGTVLVSDPERVRAAHTSYQTVTAYLHS